MRRYGTKRMYMFLITICCWVGVVGCADLGNLAEFRAVNRQNLSYLEVGMTKEQVMVRMGTGFATDVYANLQSVTATNPYKSEVRTGNRKSYEILYYYTDFVRKNRLNVHLPGIEKATPIVDKELTPVVFHKQRLIGWGHEFLKATLRNGL